MSKSKQLTYEEMQKNLMANLVKNHKYEKATNVIMFDAEKLDMPEGVTTDSIQTHVNYLNQVSGAMEVATAEITRGLYEDNDKINNVEGTMTLPGVVFNTEHTLRTEVGEEHLYGASTTITDFVHTEDASDWLAAQRESNESLARKLFG